jgi:predicted  nucleic acid-binding Zn-ribbon protein
MGDDELKSLLESLRRENAAAHVETRRHFDVVIEGARRDVRLVAEGVAQTREELARLETKVEQTAAETQAMIKFSHTDLDRRMRTLEETQSKLEDALLELQTRVERLEGSTH